MGTHRSAGWTRRHVLTTSAMGALAAGTMAGRLPGVAASRVSMSGGGGIAGGGTAETAEGEAQFSLFASRLELTDEPTPLIFGRVQWVDPNWRSRGLALVSTTVTAYGPVPDDENARELRGTMTANGEGSYPFVLRAIDGGGPGEGQDRVILTVGPDAVAGTPSAATPTDDFAYSAEATVVGGDLQLLRFDRPNQG
jgi:hypothetical protein